MRRRRIMDIDDILRDAHQHCRKNRAELERSEMWGCFYCERIFAPTTVEEWVDGGQTAMCPYCGIDSVIGSAAGIDLTPEFLRKMNDFWF